MRVTRQRAARERQALQQQQLLTEQPSGGEPMAVEPAQFNLDPLNIRDPQLCHHYTKEIYSYLRALELEHRVSPHFMQVSVPSLERAAAEATQTRPLAERRANPHSRMPHTFWLCLRFRWHSNSTHLWGDAARLSGSTLASQD